MLAEPIRHEIRAFVERGYITRDELHDLRDCTLSELKELMGIAPDDALVAYARWCSHNSGEEDKGRPYFSTMVNTLVEALIPELSKRKLLPEIVERFGTKP